MVVVFIKENDDLIFAKVKSSTDETKEYNVFVFKKDLTVSCNCAGFFFNRRCKHVKEVLQVAE